MGQGTRSSTPGDSGQLRALLTSPGFLVGAVIVITSALLANSGSAGLAEIALLVAIAGYIVAGALAPPRPFVTGFLLASIHGATAVALDQLIEQPRAGDYYAAIGAWLFVLIYAAGIVAGAFLTGIVGSVASWRKTRGR